MQENQEVKSKYSAATAQISNLSQETKSLNEKVSLAAQLDATNIRVQTLNKKRTRYGTRKEYQEDCNFIHHREEHYGTDG